METIVESASAPGARLRHGAIEARSLSKDFGGLKALRNLDFSIAAGEILGILGPNGAGKSTLINVVSGLIPATSGSVMVHGENVDSLDMAKRARKGLFRTFQNTRPSEELTGAEMLRLATLTPNKASAGVSYRMEDLLQTFGLQEFAGVTLSESPYGVQKMFGLAAVALCRPRVMFLDEPFQGVADTEIAKLSGVIRHFAAAGVAIGLVEHNVRSVMDLCKRVIVLDSGGLIFEGLGSDAVQDPKVQEAYLGHRFVKALNG